MASKEELLKVLDMSEEEQFKWLRLYGYKLHYTSDVIYNEMQMAHLAFRLRDEANVFMFGDELFMIFYNTEYFKNKDYDTFALWQASKECKPIHWIIAALIAKGEKDGN